MDMTIAGFVALGALIIGLFAWLRQDIRELRREMLDGMGSLRGEQGSLRDEQTSLREVMNKLSERVARIEGLLEAVFMRRDLTPLPEPSPPNDRPDTSRAA